MPSLLRFWRHTIGIPLEAAYGCTELGGPTTRTDSSCDRELKVGHDWSLLICIEVTADVSHLVQYRKAITRCRIEALGRERRWDSHEEFAIVLWVRCLWLYDWYLLINLSSYLGDEAKTKESMTADGFFKTSDYARRVGDEYVMEGRVSTDCKFSQPSSKTMPVNQLKLFDLVLLKSQLLK